MRLRIKLAKPISTWQGQFADFTGDFDPQTGICWLDPLQGSGRSVAPGFGIHMATGCSMQKLPEKVADKPAKKPAEDKAA